MSRTQFIVVIDRKDGYGQTRYIGPYRSFRKAEGDAKVWSDHVYSASVSPLEREVDPPRYLGGSNENQTPD
jgi:hypothetical protein